MTPPTNIKKYRKWKKEQYRLIENSLNDKKDAIEAISPFYPVKAGEKKGKEAISIFDES